MEADYRGNAPDGRNLKLCSKSYLSRFPEERCLGLGLHIASQIAKAHEGTLTATSTREETRFTFVMLLRSPTHHDPSIPDWLAFEFLPPK
jgi:K+-sensing histidine kinase KdpD